MKAYIFPGQGSQFPGMGKDLYLKSDLARSLFEKANQILGFRITDIMFEGTDQDLKQTKVTQPSIYLHSTILAMMLGDSFQPGMVAGHSLGEFSALVANKTLTFEDGLILVAKRAMAMQKACDRNPSVMAAILGLDDVVVEEVCSSVEEVVVPANYNSPGQLVISGSFKGIDLAIDKLMKAGAKRAIRLPVGGAFHSPLMEPAKMELEEAIHITSFAEPNCPIYQNVTGLPSVNSGTIKSNLVSQLVSPVRWTQSVLNMIADGATSFTEVGPGNVLQGLVRKISRDVAAGSAMIQG